jgi:signal transduction histidine kinase
MKISAYLRAHRYSLVTSLFLWALVDALALASGTLAQGLPDFGYLNLLLAVCFLLGNGVGWFRERQRFAPLREVLAKGQPLEGALPAGEGVYESLVRETAAREHDTWEPRLRTLRGQMTELQDYIVQWTHEIKIPLSVMELVLEETAGQTGAFPESGHSDADLSSEHPDEGPSPEHPDAALADGHPDAVPEAGQAEAGARRLRLALARVKFLVNQVLYAGRAASSQEDLAMSEISLQKALRAAIRTNMPFFMARDIAVEVAGMDLTVTSDEKWVVYILEQILHNAAKYTPRGGMVAVQGVPTEKGVAVMIRDTGMGIPAADLPRVFDRGFTGENGRKTEKSTGMGLYYAKRAADLLGIGLQAASEPGEGAVFQLHFFRIGDWFTPAM